MSESNTTDCKSSEKIFNVLLDDYVHEDLKTSEELLRRARLLIRFGFMGAAFGTCFSIFYAAISHFWGSAVIVFCSSVFGVIPWMIRRSGNLRLCGHVFSGALWIGFTLLCLVEGGLRGHAIAWLASVPLCALLLIQGRGAYYWGLVCSLTAFIFGLLDLIGYRFKPTYEDHWESLVSTSGYTALVLFLSLLGYIFENTRHRAFQMKQQALDALSEANANLTKLNNEKDEFLSIAAHDLKNPLGVVSGYAQLLRGQSNPSALDIEEQTSAIIRSSDRMLAIITNLLDVRTIESGKLNLRRDKCDLDSLLNQVNNDYTRAAAAKDIRLNLHIETSRAAAADIGATHQILDNLVSNAIKYTPKGRRVTVLCRSLRSDIIIDIQDEGPGLSAEDQSNLFKKFGKLTPRPTAGESSNGLGLWIASRMALEMGGDITCSSELGKGCSFVLRLPAWSDPQVEKSSADALYV
ncbi:MAG: HAMP domain-containing histidine kinase [Verrucomicrobiae bacterium]|nr:HAMP domain-containing histidine kinase [Verrucomicrobiae bacterium]